MRLALVLLALALSGSAPTNRVLVGRGTATPTVTEGDDRGVGATKASELALKLPACDSKGEGNCRRHNT